MRVGVTVLLLVACLCASTAVAWDINDPNAPLDGSVTGASTGIVDDVVIFNDVDPESGDVVGASASGTSATSGSGVDSTEVIVIDGSDAVTEVAVVDGSDAVTEVVVVDGSSAINDEGVDSSSEEKVVLATGVSDAAADKGAATGEGSLSTPKAQEAKTSAPVTVGVVIAGVAAAMGIVVGGIALLRRAARPTAAHGGVGVSAGTACTAAALQGGVVHGRHPSADSAGSESHKLRIIQVDVDDDDVVDL
jgi:hypothetical protein